MATVRTLRDLGAAVRGARLSAGLTQQQLATRIGLARQWVVLLEHGRTNPNWENVRAVCDALDLTLTLGSNTPEPKSRPAIDLAAPEGLTVDEPIDLDTVIDSHTRTERDHP